jgi:hypothetical protein
MPDSNERRLICEAIPVEFEAAAGEGGPKQFEAVAYTAGKIFPRYFPYGVVIDLSGLRAEAEQTPVFLGHDSSRIVGHGVAEITPRRVKIAKGFISGGGQAAREVQTAAANNFPWKMSVGVNSTKIEFVKAGATAEANGQKWRGPVEIVRAGVLGEISFVPRGADPKTSAKIAAEHKDPTMNPKFKEWLEAKGFEPDNLSEEQLVPLQAAFDAEQKPAPKPPPLPGKKDGSQDTSLEASAGSDGDGDPVAEHRTLMAAEAKRIAEVTAVCRKHPELVAKAIDEGWDEGKAKDQVELVELRASRSQAPAGHVTSGPDFDARVIEAAACRTLNLGVDDDYEPKTLEAADKFFRRGIGLQEMLLLAARANGFDRHVIRLRSETDIKEVLHAAYGRPLQATAYSEANISNILSNVANKSILAAFNAVESAWRKIAKIGSVSDFKTHTRVRLTGDLTYEELGETGEIKHGKIADETTTISAKTYAKMLVLTRNDIINDDLGALDGVRTKIGRGAALKINNVFWTAFLDNSSFFTTARGNLLEGTAYALTATDPIAALDAAVKLFLDQTDPDGDPVAIDPALMLVPTALVGSAGDLYQSTEVRTGGGSTKTRVPTTNRYAGQFEPIVSRYLGNSSYTGYSATAWYLLANPADLPVIEIAFLNGQQAPTVESADADFNMLGIQFRGYHDFGVSKQEYRAGVKVTGAAAS